MRPYKALLGSVAAAVAVAVAVLHIGMASFHSCILHSCDNFVVGKQCMCREQAENEKRKNRGVWC